MKNPLIFTFLRNKNNKKLVDKTKEITNNVVELLLQIIENLNYEAALLLEEKKKKENDMPKQ